MSYNDELNKRFEGCHRTPTCDGTWEHLLEEDVMPPNPQVTVMLTNSAAKVSSFAHCKKCGAKFYTPGFEHWLETYYAFKLMDKKTPLTDQEKHYLRLHFQMLGS